MARHESDREDLLREAVALRERVELACPGEAETIVAGFRESNFLSIYFGGDAAFHFDDGGRLRRAFEGGQLYRSQGDSLIRLTRIRTHAETQLQRHHLAPEELHEFLSHVQSRLLKLRAALQDGSTRTIGQVPSDGDLRPRLIDAISGILHPQLRLSPRLKP